MSEQDANILGALALVVADQTSAAIAEASGQSVSGAAALSALDQFLDRPRIDQLRQVLGLTHSGAVRLVDKLAAEGLVARTPGQDGRSRAIILTDQGRRIAGLIATARLSALRHLIERLPSAQREALGPLVAALLEAVVTHKDGGAWICRLCDLTACRRAEGLCPAANAAAAKYGPP